MQLTPNISFILPHVSFTDHSLCIHHFCALRLPVVYLSLVLTKFVQRALIVRSGYAHRPFTVQVGKLYISGTVSDTKDTVEIL